MPRRPFIVSWDDHEVSNNYAGDFDEKGTPPELFVLRRAAAYQAYYESMPLRASAWPSGSHMRIHRRLQFGTLIDLNVLDTRQWRSDQAVRRRQSTATARRRWRRIGRCSARSRSAGCSTIWRNASARWTVIGQQVPTLRARHGQASFPTAASRWTNGTATSRRATGCTRGCRRRRRRTRSCCRATCTCTSARISRRTTRNPRSATVGVEFTNSSITSTGDGSDVFARLGPDQGRQPAHQVPQRPPRLHRVHRHARVDASRLQNPRSRHRGRPADTHRRFACGRSRQGGKLHGLTEHKDQRQPRSHESTKKKH